MTPSPPRTIELFLVAAPGTEALVEAEARSALPDAVVTAQPGGVQLVGDSSLVARANLRLRIATRVLVRLGTFDARREGQLERGVAALPLSAWLPTGARLSIRASAARCRLYHTGVLVEHAARGATSAIGSVLAIADEGDDDAFALLLRGGHDRFTVSLDTSGALLHRRGWRIEGGEAPLRETLAAALLALARYDGGPLCDPMCGSGTIAIEAALRARRVAPGLSRSFAFEHFVNHDRVKWQRLVEEARAEIRDEEALVIAADADAAQLELARANAARAGVTIALEHVALERLVPRAPQGLLATNAPYGKRVGAADGSLAALHRALRRALGGRFASWRAAVLVGDRRHATAIGLTEGHALPNGGLRTWLGLRASRG